MGALPCPPSGPEALVPIATATHCPGHLFASGVLERVGCGARREDARPHTWPAHGGEATEMPQSAQVLCQQKLTGAESNTEKSAPASFTRDTPHPHTYNWRDLLNRHRCRSSTTIPWCSCCVLSEGPRPRVPASLIMACTCQTVCVRHQYCGHDSVDRTYCDAARARADAGFALVMCGTRLTPNNTTQVDLCEKTGCLLSERNGTWTCCACNAQQTNVDTCQNVVDGTHCYHVLCRNCP